MIPAFIKWLYRKPQQYLIRWKCQWNGRKLIIPVFNKVVIISPHPDDEVFGCGGLIVELIERGYEIDVIFLSKGEALGIDADSKKRMIEERRKLTYSALGYLGIKIDHIHYLDFRDGEIRKTNKIEVKRLRNLINELNPNAIFYPHPFEGSPDHNHASMICDEITKNVNCKRYYYCVWLWHHARLKDVMRLDYTKSLLLKVDRPKKKLASDIYSDAKDEAGVYYSGKLPKLFLQAVNWKYELFWPVN